MRIAGIADKSSRLKASNSILGKHRPEQSRVEGNQRFRRSGGLRRAGLERIGNFGVAERTESRDEKRTKRILKSERS